MIEAPEQNPVERRNNEERSSRADTFREGLRYWGAVGA
jgi:hypothetical protein